MRSEKKRVDEEKGMVKQGCWWMRGGRLLIGIVFGLVWVAAGYGEPQEPEGVYTLGEVVVSAEMNHGVSQGTVREITAEDIRVRGARTLDEAIALVPGVYVMTGGGGVPRITMRGFRPRQVLLLVDGVPFNSTYDGQFDPSVIPVENIATIKIAYGNHSVLYGDGGLGGVINIITKKGGEKTHGMIGGEGGDRDHHLGKYSLSGGKGSLDYFISGSSFETDGYAVSDHFHQTIEENGGLRENSDRERTNIFGNIGYVFGEDLEIGVIASYNKSEYGIPPSVIGNGVDVFAQAPKYERVDDLEATAGQLSARYAMSDSVLLRGALFMNRQDEERVRYDDDTYSSLDDPSVKGSYVQDSITLISGGYLQTRCDFGLGGAFTLGINGRRESYDADGRIKDRSRSGGSARAGGGGGGGAASYEFRAFDTDRHLSTYSLAFEYEVSPLPNLGIILGYSHHWNRKEHADNDDDGCLAATLQYDMKGDLHVRASFARNVRFPSIQQLYDEAMGNPFLDTETAKNYEVSLCKGLAGETEFSLTGFYMDVDDYINKGDDDTFQNNEKYRFRGFEMALERRFTEDLMVRAGYTFLDAEDRSSGSGKSEVAYNPKHRITVEGAYCFESGLTLYLNTVYGGKQYYYSRKGPVLKDELDDYTLANVKLSQKLLRDQVEVYLGVDNIGDEDYEQNYGLPQAGRFFYAGMEARF